MVIFTELMAGNFHDACRFANKHDLAEHVVTLSRIGSFTQIVYRMPKEKAASLAACGVFRVPKDDLCSHQ